MQDNYVGMELNWHDISFTSKLCKQGSFIIYKAREGFGLTDDWMSRFVAPAITGAFDEGVGAVLRQALLWAYMDPVLAADVVRLMSNKRLQLNSSSWKLLLKMVKIQSKTWNFALKAKALSILM